MPAPHFSTQLPAWLLGFNPKGRWRRVLGAAVCLAPFSILWLGVACAKGQDGGFPRSVGEPLQGPLSCATPRLDFGQVFEGQRLEARFDFQVQSEEPLLIESVRADCGCTATALLRRPGGAASDFVPYELKTPLEPGDLLRLEARYDTRGKRGQAPRNVTLYADVPGGRAQVGLLADVKPWLVAEPDELIVGRMGRRETREKEIRVRSFDGAVFALSHDRRAVPDTLQVELTPLDPDQEGRASEWKAVVVLGPDLPEGAHQYPLYLESDHDLGSPDAAEAVQASCTPQIIVEVVGLYRVQPSSFSFSGVSASTTVAETVHLECFDPAAQNVLPKARLEASGVRDREASQALTETARLSVRAAEGGGWDVQLLLEGLSPTVGNRFLAQVLLETGNPEHPLVEIPVIGFRARSGTQEH